MKIQKLLVQGHRVLNEEGVEITSAEKSSLKGLLYSTKAAVHISTLQLLPWLEGGRATSPGRSHWKRELAIHCAGNHSANRHLRLGALLLRGKYGMSLMFLCRIDE